MSVKEDAYAACPYYKFHSKQLIHCAGISPGTALHLAFSTPRQLDEYKNLYCRRCWKNCLIAEMLNRKWSYEA